MKMLFEEAIGTKTSYGATGITTPTEEAVFKNGYKIIKSLITNEVKVYNTLVKRDFYEELDSHEVDLLLREGWVQGTKSLYLHTLKLNLFFMKQDMEEAIEDGDFVKSEQISEQIKLIISKIKSK